MTRLIPASETLWTALRRNWLSAVMEPPADPRLADDARMVAPAPARCLPPLVQAWLH